MGCRSGRIFWGGWWMAATRGLAVVLFLKIGSGGRPTVARRSSSRGSRWRKCGTSAVHWSRAACQGIKPVFPDESREAQRARLLASLFEHPAYATTYEDAELQPVRELLALFAVDGVLSKEAYKEYLQGVGLWDGRVSASGASQYMHEARRYTNDAEYGYDARGWREDCKEMGCNAAVGLTAEAFETILYGRGPGLYGQRRFGKARADLERAGGPRTSRSACRPRT